MQKGKKFGRKKTSSPSDCLGRPEVDDGRINQHNKRPESDRKNGSVFLFEVYQGGFDWKHEVRSRSGRPENTYNYLRSGLGIFSLYLYMNKGNRDTTVLYLVTSGSTEKGFHR